MKCFTKLEQTMTTANKTNRPAMSIAAAGILVGLVVSGLALFTAPPCSVATAIGWHFLFLRKASWETIHIVFAVAFVIVVVCHLRYNWGTLTGHFARGTRTAGGISRSALIAIIIAVVLFVLSALQLPPVSWVYDAHERIKFSHSPGGGQGQGGGGGNRGRGMRRQASDRGMGETR